IPCENWDSTGYVSVHLVDAVSANDPAGFGENYRVYSNEPNGAFIVLNDGGQDLPMTSFRLSSPPAEKFNELQSVDFHSENGKKFGVMMHDVRQQGRQGPYPAESMMSIVPISR